MKHREKHPSLDVEGCFTCRVSSVMFGADTMPTRTGDVSEKNAREKALQKDLVSYKNMVKDGRKPPSLTGAHRYEAEAK